MTLGLRMGIGGALVFQSLSCFAADEAQYRTFLDLAYSDAFEMYGTRSSSSGVYEVQISVLQTDESPSVEVLSKKVKSKNSAGVDVYFCQTDYRVSLGDLEVRLSLQSDPSAKPQSEIRRWMWRSIRQIEISLADYEGDYQCLPQPLWTTNDPNEEALFYMEVVRFNFPIGDAGEYLLLRPFTHLYETPLVITPQRQSEPQRGRPALSWLTWNEDSVYLAGRREHPLFTYEPEPPEEEIP